MLFELTVDPVERRRDAQSVLASANAPTKTPIPISRAPTPTSNVEDESAPTQNLLNTPPGRARSS